MTCLTPVQIKNPAWSSHDCASRKDEFLLVPCGKCAACLQTRANNWAFRIEQELKVCDNAYFVTLTYSDKCQPKKSGVPVVSRNDIRKFHYRLKKDFSGIRYFFFSEYSPEPLFRPHYHAIYFNLDVPADCLHVAVKKYLCKYWKFGIVDVRNVDVARIKYCANYSISKNDLPEFYQQKDTKPFFFVSQHFGENFVTDKVVAHYKRNLKPLIALNGYRLGLPRFYKEKIFSEDEKSIISERAKEYVRQHAQSFEDALATEEAKASFNKNFFERHKKRSRYLTRNIE